MPVGIIVLQQWCKLQLPYKLLYCLQESLNKNARLDSCTYLLNDSSCAARLALDELSHHPAGSFHCICSATDVHLTRVTFGEVLVHYNVSLTGLLQGPDSLTTSADNTSNDAWWTLHRPLHFSLGRVVADDLLNEVLGCFKIVGVLRGDGDSLGVTRCSMIDLNPCPGLVLQMLDGLPALADDLANKGGRDLQGCCSL